MNFLKHSVVMEKLQVLIVSTLLFIFFGLFTPVMSQTMPAEAASPCNMPEFDRAATQGIFIWQVCSTGEWFLRVSAGGLPSGVGAEYNVVATLELSEPILELEAFSLEANDSLDSSDLTKLQINFRAFTDSQDGFNFKLEEGATACLKVYSPGAANIVIGGENTTVKSPVNLNSLDGVDCSGILIVAPVFLLLES